MSEYKDKPLHIAMYPWFAFGHLTSFLRLANKLAERGHKISFFLPTRTQYKVASHNHHVPAVDGLPPGAETTADVPASARILIMAAMDQTQDMIDFHLAQIKLDFIFFDFTQWIPSLARRHQVKSVYYATTYLVSFAYLSPLARKLPFSEADLVKLPPGFPCSDIFMHAREARALANLSIMEFGGGITYMERRSITLKECDAIAVKTCKEMEGPYYDFVEKHMGKPILLAGPVVPEPPASKLDENFNVWLKGFSNNSVVYCAIGSECVLEKNQFHELVLGLELTGTQCKLCKSNAYKVIKS